MEAVILSGGLGTRLSGVVRDIPKPMAMINNKPFLSYLFAWLNNFDITTVVMATGYRSEVISEYFGNRYDRIQIRYSEEDHPLGTGGAIARALEYTTAPEVLILNGDTYFPIDIERFAGYHKQNNSIITVALKKMTAFDRYGSVEVINDTIMSFREKRKVDEGFINGGIYMLNSSFAHSMPGNTAFSFEKEILEKEAGSGRLKGIVFDDEFIDIGIPEDYYRAQDMMKGKNENTRL